MDIATSPSASGGWPSSVVRRARPADLAALEAFFERCSEESRYRRFHGATGSTVRMELRRMANPTDRHRSFVAVADGEVHGTATLAWGSDGVVEVAFLVEDGWSRHHLGRALLEMLLVEAHGAGLTQVTARIQGDNERARRFVRSVAPSATGRFAGAGELEFDIPVDAVPSSALALAFITDAIAAQHTVSSTNRRIAS